MIIDYMEVLQKSAQQKTDKVKLVSCGCCTNGCVCFNHRDESGGIFIKKCDLHQDLSGEEFLVEWRKQYV